MYLTVEETVLVKAPAAEFLPVISLVKILGLAEELIVERERRGRAGIVVGGGRERVELAESEIRETLKNSRPLFAQSLREPAAELKQCVAYRHRGKRGDTSPVIAEVVAVAAV